MAQLIAPNENQHQYVVGIDFGHGETSAAICPIEWGKDAGQRETNVLDIDLDRAARKKVITSAICRVPDGIIIGEQAFDHMTDNNGIRVCFKQKPQSIDGKAERLMIDYMRAVYERIRENQEELTDTNHVVYIARPSGWVEEEAKELYRQMAIQAGIPLGGLTSESRAAIFYAKSPNVNFAKEISNGAIVFDLGSSTVDFTYLSDTNKPIDYGYNLGASIIDNAIFENMILKDEAVTDFINKYPAYKDALIFKARKFKEEAYGRNQDSKTIGGFPLDNVIDENEESYDDYADIYVKLRIANLAELNNMIDSTTNYMDKLKNALADFRDNHISGKTVNGVFLTGGASRMNFIRPLIAETFNIPIGNVKIDNDNPSLTVSRGIALLGATDAITSILVSKLRQSLPSLVKDDKMLDRLVELLSKNITDEAWGTVKSACRSWVSNGTTTDEDELKQTLNKELEKFKANRIPFVINKTVQSFLVEVTEDIRKRMNVIISRYAPGREITAGGTISLDDSAIKGSLSIMSSTLSSICDSITNIVSDILWAVLGIVLFGLYSVAYYVIKGAINFFRDDKDKRQDKANKILEKEMKVKSELSSNIRTELLINNGFKTSVTKSLKEYLNKLIETNLEQVRIPIE